MIVFSEQDVIVAQSTHIPQAVNVIKAMNPFPSFRPLTSNVEHSIEYSFENSFSPDNIEENSPEFSDAFHESDFIDARCGHSKPKHVLFIGYISWLGNTVDFVHKTAGKCGFW